MVGLDDQQALSILSDAELGGNVVQRDDVAPAGQVVGQSPGPGRMVKRGSPVTIFVSSGAISVPDVVGQTRKSGGDRAEAGRLHAVGQRGADGRSRRRTAASSNQFPPAGSRGQRGDLVTITVGALTP